MSIPCVLPDSFESLYALTVDHKGTPCWLPQGPFCQEGICQNCEIYRVWKEAHE